MSESLAPPRALPPGAIAPGAMDGTDAGAMPVFAAEATVLGIPRSQWPSIIAPMVVGIIALAFWEWIVWYKSIPHYVLPGPIQIGQTLITDWPTLSGSSLSVWH
jgi:NitT/TauT family transport system permease protein